LLGDHSWVQPPVKARGIMQKAIGLKLVRVSLSRFSVLQATESLAGPGYEAKHSQHMNVYVHVNFSVCEGVSGRNHFVVHFDSVTAFKIFCAELKLGEGLITCLDMSGI